MGTHGRLGAGAAGPAAVGGGDRRKSRRAEGKEPAEESKGSPRMELSGEAGLMKIVVALCRDWPEGKDKQGGGGRPQPHPHLGCGATH